MNSASSWRMELSLLPKSPLRGFSDVAAVLFFLVLVLIVAIAYLLSRYVAAHFDDWPRLAAALFITGGWNE